MQPVPLPKPRQYSQYYSLNRKGNETAELNPTLIVLMCVCFRGVRYSVGSDTCSSGLHMIDLKDPAKPAFAGEYTVPSSSGRVSPRVQRMDGIIGFQQLFVSRSIS